MRSVFTTFVAFVISTQSAFAEQVWLTMDRVEPYRLEKEADSIAVGNPAVADVTVRDNNNILLFGKSPGMTNIYFFDDAGEVITNLIVRVRTPATDMVTLHHGITRVTYNCTFNCEVAPTIGDDKEVFNTNLAQVQLKVGQAESAEEAAE